MTQALYRWFHLKEKGTTIRTELIAGTITFATIAYILAINPNILSVTGMDSTAILLATCLASAFASFLMGILANMPFALSAGMGLNAYFAYTVVLTMGYDWRRALLAVFVEGFIFVVLSWCGVREKLFDMIPQNLRVAISVGIGGFIAFIGLQNVGMVVDSATLVGLADFKANFSTAGICILLFVIGVLITGILAILKVPGAILIGIGITWALGGLCQVIGIYVPNAESGFYSLALHWESTDFGALAKTFGQCFSDIPSGVGEWITFGTVVMSFLFVDVFDTMGTLTGCLISGNMMNKDGTMPKSKQMFLADAFGTMGGALCGTSTITSFVESSSGIMAGGRSGLTAIVVGIWFLLSTFASSIFTSIPSFATAPALVIVGAMMMANVTDWKFASKTDYAEIIPSFLCAFTMTYFYSISEGIAFGIISYAALNLLGGKSKRQNVTGLMVVVVVLFILKYAMFRT